MNDSASATDRIVRDILASLPPRLPCIELIDPLMVPVLRKKTPSERLAIANGMWRSARKLIESAVRQRHPDWSDQEVQREVARRMSHGMV